MATTSTAKKVKKKNRRRVRNIIYSVLVALVVFLLLRYIVVRPTGETSVVENGVGTLFTPVQKVFSTVTGFVKSWFGTGTSEKEADIETQLEELQMENERLQIEMNSLDEVQARNKELETLLGAREDYEALSPVYAKVIAKDTGMWFETFTINKGQNDGISPNMAVVNADGLIGRVNAVGLNFATVISIIDSRSSVASLVSRTRDNGMLQGQTETDADGTECRMYYIANLANIKVGDSVYTSGLDSRFPKGIYIGTVTAVSRSATSSDKYAVVQPGVNFSSVEDVFVLRELVQTVDSLPVVVTPTPIPIVTPAPTATVGIYNYVTPSVVNDDEIYLYPTATPDPNVTPTPTPTPRPTKPNPEAAWLNDK